MCYYGLNKLGIYTKIIVRISSILHKPKSIIHKEVDSIFTHRTFILHTVLKEMLLKH